MANYTCSTDNLDNTVIPCATTPGQEKTVYVALREEFIKANPQFDTVQKNVITGFTMASGTYLFRMVMLLNQATRGIAGAKSDDGRTDYPSTITIQAENTPVGNEIVAGLANNELVVIIDQKAKGDYNDAAYEVHGFNSGLVATPTMEAPANEWTLALSNLEGSVSKQPHYFFTTIFGTDTYSDSTDGDYLETKVYSAS